MGVIMKCPECHMPLENLRGFPIHWTFRHEDKLGLTYDKIKPLAQLDEISISDVLLILAPEIEDELF